ncbi:MAG: ketoacyl-ACP synthase III [Clostridia bacterium]|nr:ketoacyl-ACP synthase III [Clostridia bacterium]
MYQNIVFSGVGTYHPANKVGNEYFIEHFKQMDIKVEGLMNHLGRKTRYFANRKSENVVTMGLEASRKALINANLVPEDIDMIIFATDTPEFLCPSNALLLNDQLKAKNAHLVFDLNSNCIGMLTAISVASRIMMSDANINKALVVGSMFASLMASQIDPVVYSNFADSGAALVLEKKEAPERIGFIDSNFKTDTCVKENFLMPKVGLSKMFDASIDIEDKKLRLDPFDTSFIAKEWCELITELLEKNNVELSEVSNFMFSQFSKPDAELTLEMLGVDKNMHSYIGDKYGYTGVTSPIIAFHDAVKNNQVKRGDNIVFCSVGGGYNISAILYKFY